jgi:hypothetical protein
MKLIEVGVVKQRLEKRAFSNPGTINAPAGLGARPRRSDGQRDVAWPKAPDMSENLHFAVTARNLVQITPRIMR